MFTNPAISTPLSPPLTKALAGIVRDPVSTLWTRWNWKASALSIAFRTPLYIIASFRSGWRETFAALLVESVYCVCTAGFYGAFVQAVRNARPAWLTGLVITLFLPAVMQAAECGVHWLRGTHHLQAVQLSSIAVSAISSLFNWFAMQRGALLVAGEGASFAGDLRRLPLLAVSFIISGPRSVCRTWNVWRRMAPHNPTANSVVRQDGM